jgi:HEAT repeat protein
LGVDKATALLRDPDPEQRQRGFERLSSVGTAQALDLLLKAFEPGGAARSAEDRLLSVRALSAHAARPLVRDFLVRIMVGVGTNPGPQPAIDGLIERAAALSLARTGDELALSALGKALRQPGHVASAASDALLAFPPRNLQPIVQGLGSATRAQAILLGKLADPRAIPALRAMVESAATDVRPDAALSLARLGVLETIDLARDWLKHEVGQEFRVAAARILLEFHTADAGTAVARLLADESNRAIGLELARHVNLPELTAPLIRGAQNAPADEQSAWLAALARTGTREAFSFLGGALSKRETASAAALALALSPADQADSVLEQALRSATTRRAAVRAGCARQIALGRTPRGLESALGELGRTGDPSDRAVFLQASVVLSSERLPALLKAAQGFEVLALAHAALLPGAAHALTSRLAGEPDPALREALAAGLVSEAAADLVPNAVLLDLLEAGSLAAPLAARALAARDSPALRPKILVLLASEDPLLRSHVALGLAQSKDASALGVLERAYRFEADPTVRLAIVRALSARPEAARRRVLDMARWLDGAAEVREAAALAVTGAQPEPVAAGQQTAWLELRLAAGADATGSFTRGAAIVTANGLALPAVADPDGVLLLPALPTGPFELRLAAPTRTDNAALPRPP